MAAFRLSLRNRIIAGNVALVALTLLLFAGASRFVIGQVLWRGLDLSLRDQAEPGTHEFPPQGRPHEGDPGRFGPQGQGRPGEGGPFPPNGGGPGFQGPNGQDQMVSPMPGQGMGQGRPRGNFGPPQGGPPQGGQPFQPQGQGQDGQPFRPMNNGGPPEGDGPRPEGQPRRVGYTLLLKPTRQMRDGQGHFFPAGDADSVVYDQEALEKTFSAGREVWTTIVNAEDQRLRVYSAPIRGGAGIVGVTQTAAPTQDTETALAGVTLGLAILLPVLALVAGFLGLLLTRRALDPVRDLTQAAGQIGAERLSERLPEPGGDDEFDRLSKHLNRMLARIETAFERQKQFTSNASHELRTPLAVIKTATTLLLGSTPLPPELTQEAIRGADSAADRANRLVGDLLFLARTENGALPVRPSQFAVVDVLQMVAREAKVRRGDTPSATVTVNAPPDLTARTDRDLLMRLVGNLVDNALRHTPAEGNVSLHARVEGQRLAIAVRDTGAGIAPEHRERLGQPFYRPDLSRRREDGGAGLGLSICHAIAHALGGTMNLESEVGKGTLVTVRLPAPSTRTTLPPPERETANLTPLSH